MIEKSLEAPSLDCGEGSVAQKHKYYNKLCVDYASSPGMCDLDSNKCFCRPYWPTDTEWINTVNTSWKYALKIEIPRTISGCIFCKKNVCKFASFQ